jgi:large subunit ribosomal protein L11
MSQEKFDFVKLQIKGRATPVPPIGPALGQRGVNIQQFCKQYNDLMKDKDPSATFPVVIKIARDKSFTIIVKEQPTPKLILQAVKLSKGSKLAGRETIGKISTKEIDTIAMLKMKDMGLAKVSSARCCVIGTAKSMGIEISD